MLRCARHERELAEEHREQRRLPRAVAAGDGDAVAGREVDVDGAQPERPALRDGALQRGEAVAAALAGAERQAQLPRLERLLDLVDALERALGLTHLGHQRVRAATVGAAGVLAHRVAVGARLARALLEQRLDVPAPLLCIGEALVLPQALERAPLRVLAPAARPLPDPVRPRVDLDDPRHDPVEERAVVRDDDEAALAPQQEALEPVEAVEVEVVRRLVEQQHVEAGEQDRREREPGRLPAGELRGRPVELDVEAELGADGARPRVEVAAAEREEPLERERVRLAGGRIRREGGGAVGERLLRVRDPGAARKVAAHRLVRPCVRLLRQVPDGQRRRRARDRPRVGRLEPRCEPEQRRLAHAVRADEAEALLGADRQRDVGEDGAGAVVSGDAGELDSHAGNLLIERGRAPSGRGAARVGCARSVRHGRAPGRRQGG